MSVATAAVVAAPVGTVVVAVVPSAVGKLQWVAVGTVAARAGSDTVVLAVVAVELQAFEWERFFPPAGAAAAEVESSFADKPVGIAAAVEGSFVGRIVAAGTAAAAAAVAAAGFADLPRVVSAVMDVPRTRGPQLVEAKQRASDQCRETFHVPPPRGRQARPIWPGSVAWSSMGHRSRFF